MKVKTTIMIVFILCIFFCGCGPVTSHYTKVEHFYSTHRFEEADKVIDENKDGYGDANAVLYYMDKGMTAHLSGEYEKSNEYLTLAEDQIDLIRKGITDEIGSMLTNDNTLPYEGEDFEKVMINIVMALNYVYLDKWDDALVEARKVDHKLNLFNDKYEKQSIYKEDALARYLSGILFEAKGEINDSLIEYRKAYETLLLYKKNYGTPILPYIYKDLLRTTEALRFDEEFEKYKKEFDGIKWEPSKSLRKKGEIIVIIYNGKSPIKEDYFITAAIPEEYKMKGVIRMAFPKFISRAPYLSNFTVDINKKNGNYSTYLIEDITAIARKDLEDRIGRITLKATARAIAKYIATNRLRNEAGKSGNPLVAGLTWLGTNIFSIASEQSDKRSWRTLPAEIHIARIVVEPGEYTLNIRPMNYYNIEGKKDRAVSIKAGEKKIIGVCNY